MTPSVLAIVMGLITLGVVGLITVEDKHPFKKTPVSLLLMAVLWTMILTVPSLAAEAIVHKRELSMAEVLGLLGFLFAAMFIVEALTHIGVFDWIRWQLARRGLPDRSQAIAIFVLTFFISAVLDNLTVTLVFARISMLFFTGNNRKVVYIGLVTMANAGGAFSPIGDVTTIMIWLAEKFTAGQVIFYTFLPSAVHAVVAGRPLLQQIVGDTHDVPLEGGEPHKFDFRSRVIITVGLAAFTLPLIAIQIGVPPFMYLLAGAAVVMILLDVFHFRHTHATKEETTLEDLIRQVDWMALFFFIGILLSIAALDAVGLLEWLSHLLLGEQPSYWRLVAFIFVLGLASAVVDNVPLTAVALVILPTNDPALWALLAYAVGVGGSHLLYGSVAGVIIEGQIARLNNGDKAEHLRPSEYIRIATWPVFKGYIAGFAVWIAQVTILQLLA